jgi:hypothetical protein
VFKPGDVYWLYNSKLAGWGPLAPAEEWQPSAAPEQFLNVNTTYAGFQANARTIDPAGFKDRPKEPLGVAVFALALPSPALPASRLEATRPMLRVGATRLNVVVPGTTFPDSRDTNDVPPPAPPPMPPVVVTNPASDAPPNVSAGPAPDPGPSGPPMQVIYPVPMYTGIVVINPPEHPDYSRRNPNTQGSKKAPTPAAASAPVPLTPPSAPTPPPTTSRSTPLPPAGRPGTSSKPGATVPAPTTPPTTPASTPPIAAPRVSLPSPRPTAPPLERPSPVPIPVGRETPRAPRPEPKPESKPESKPAPKTDSTPDDKTSPRQDTSRASKK